VNKCIKNLCEIDARGHYNDPIYRAEDAAFALITCTKRLISIKDI
jgi:hypothetical protein